jgi:(p)ppGpp synthase/HD superfamily hydrolase
VTWKDVQRRLEDSIAGNISDSDVRMVRRAFDVAEEAHADQTRDEGAPYIIHPLRVALSLVEEVEIYSPGLISAALLHDVIEDSPITREQISEMFGEEIARVVWLLTKFENVSLADYLAAIEAAADTGAPLVKLCDRLDNLRYLPASPSAEKKHRYIRTTERYYLPMAQRTNAYLYDQIRAALGQVRREVDFRS